MKKKAIMLAFLAAALLTTGCQKNESAPVEQSAGSQTEEASIPTLSKEEANELVMTALTSIKTTLDELGTENGWNVQNPADFTIMKEALQPYVTDELIDRDFQIMKDEYYLETDIEFIPVRVLPTVRSTVEQDEDKLRVDTFEPANDMYDGTAWTFEFVYEQEQWKLNDWEASELTSLGLTQEEAEVYMTSLDWGVVSFEKEIETDDGKAYVFTVGGDTIALNPNTTAMIYGYEDEEETVASVEEIEVEEAESEETTVAQPAESSSTGALPSKSEYLVKLDSLVSLEVNSGTGVTVDILQDSSHNYEIWDGALNELYQLLQNNLSASESEALLIAQRQWLQDTDAYIEQTALEEGGAYDENGELTGTVGTMYSITSANLSVQTRKERCYELVNLYLQ